MRAAEAERLGQSSMRHQGNQLSDCNSPPQVINVGLAALGRGNGSAHVDKSRNEMQHHSKGEVLSAAAVFARLVEDDAVLDGEDEAGAHEAEGCERG